MASAMLKGPNRKSPPSLKRLRQSRHSAMTRLMSACTSGVTPRLGKLERIFIGRWLRSAGEAAWISKLRGRRPPRALGPELRLGKELGEVLTDRQRFPDDEVAMAERRHSAGGGLAQDAGARI